MYNMSIILKTIVIDYRSQQTDTGELEDLRDQLSYSNARILDLEEQLENNQDQLRRMIEDCSAEWEWDQ